MNFVNNNEILCWNNNHHNKRDRIYYKDVHKVVNFIISITNIVFWSLWKEIKVNKNYINLKLSHTTDWLTESKFRTNKNILSIKIG